ncbi:MAG: serine O-acetyltransferase [Planctomycetota bacterium]|jgi:serine O-acetyltransferase|nr:serine acetyltransferase [Blastopirellula sp.]
MSPASNPPRLSQIAQDLDQQAFRLRFRREIAADCQLPSASDIDRLLTVYRHLMFPSIFAPEANLATRTNWITEATLEELQQQLLCLMSWTLSGFTGPEGSAPRTSAVDMTTAVLQQLPAISRLLATDVQAAVDGDPACQNMNEVVICYPGFHAIMIHRLAHEVWNSGATLLARMISEWSHSLYGIDIHPQAVLGSHLFIDHGTGVVIGQTCHVGNHVKIYQGVTLGALSFPKNERGEFLREVKRHPTIEDYVVIYANSTVLGGSTIVGHHSVVGSSVWLTESIAPYTTIVMEKPRLRLRSQQPTPFDLVNDYQI